MIVALVIIAWLVLGVAVVGIWVHWYKPHAPPAPDQWRRYRGIAKLRDPANEKLDLSSLRGKPTPPVFRVGDRVRKA